MKDALPAVETATVRARTANADRLALSVARWARFTARARQVGVVDVIRLRRPTLPEQAALLYLRFDRLSASVTDPASGVAG